jgi:hypothetical protein
VLTVNIEGSTFPNFTDGTQTRILSFEGDEVTYFNPTPSMGGSAKVTYRRAKLRRHSGSAPVKDGKSDRGQPICGLRHGQTGGSAGVKSWTPSGCFVTFTLAA